MNTQTLNRLALAGLLVLAGLFYVLSAVTAQAAGEDPHHSTEPADAVDHDATAPGPPLYLTVVAAIVAAQQNSTSTPPNKGDSVRGDTQGAANEAPSVPGRPSLEGITHNAVSLTWGAVSGATHYDARYRDRDGGGPNVAGNWLQINDIDGTNHTFSGLSSSTRYEFYVRAANAAGDSDWSPKRYGTTTARFAPLTLPEPSDRTLTKRVPTSFTLPLANGGNAPYSHSVSGLPAGLSFNASSRTVSGAPTTVGTSTVTYHVTDSSSTLRRQTFTITVTTDTVPSAPGRPTLTGTTHHSVSLTWGKVNGATHYDARYRDRDAGGSGVPGDWSQVDNIPGRSRTFSGLTARTRYEFEVRAGNNAGDSGWSPNRYATTTAAPPPPTPTPPPPPSPPPPNPLPRPEPPTIITAQGSHVDSIKVSWRPHISVTKYRVRYRNHDDAVWITSQQTATSIEIAGRYDCRVLHNFEISGWGDGLVYAEKWGTPAVREDLHSICPPVYGHQADHTVKWQKGTYPPPPEKSEKYHEDALRVFDEGIPAGAAMWDRMADVITVCTSCSNPDEQVYTVQMGPSYTCPRSYACVDRETLPADGHRFPHLASATMTFELIGQDKKGFNVVWTTVEHLHKEDAEGFNNRYYYINAVAAHEFGHTVGIMDLDTRPQFWDSIMADPGNFTPSDTDEKIVRAMYLGHQSHALNPD